MDERRKDLCYYRLDKAEKCLASAKVLTQSGDYCGATNRSYYSIFHSIRSLLALEGVDMKVISPYLLPQFTYFYLKILLMP